MLAELTETQRRRCEKLEAGLSMREIADQEGTSVQSVHESVMAARKKLEKYRKHP